MIVKNLTTHQDCIVDDCHQVDNYYYPPYQLSFASRVGIEYTHILTIGGRIFQVYYKDFDVTKAYEINILDAIDLIYEQKSSMNDYPLIISTKGN